MLRRKSDFLAQLEDLLFTQDFLGLASADLELSRAREHTLERSPVEARGLIARWEIGIASHTPKYTARFSVQIPPSTTSICRVTASRMLSGMEKVAVNRAVGSPLGGAIPAERR